jgi:hypothetical protein
MKQKLFAILVLVCLLAASSGPAFAQEVIPPKSSEVLGNLLNGLIASPNDKGPVEITKTGTFSVPEPSKDYVAPSLVDSALTTTPIVNGGFEQGRFAGWSESSNYGYEVVSPLAYYPSGLGPHSGNWIAALGLDDYAVTTLSQSNIAVAGPTTLRLWYWIISEDDCGYDVGYIIINSTIVYVWDLCYYKNTSGWVPLDINLNAYNGQTVALSIEVYTDESYLSALLIDDVSLYGTFADVPYGYWSWSYIEGLYNAGVTAGCGSGNYCPTTTVTRDQMAVFLLKAKHTSSYTPPAPTGAFSDVPTNYWAAAWIEQLADEGITAGCGGGNYCPTNPVTRDQMAVFLLKAKHGFDYVPPAATGVFQDVPVNHWAAAWVERLAAEGITAGCNTSPLLYCPGAPVSRDQMAVFLVRTFGLPTP